jgi:hypothetical protein
MQWYSNKCACRKRTTLETEEVIVKIIDDNVHEFPWEMVVGHILVIFLRL